MSPSLSDLIPVLSTAIGPTILISGVGLLLLSMTNRFGRIVDRSRELVDALREAKDEETRRRIEAQVPIFARRARLIRRAVLLAAISVLLAACLIIALFAIALLQIEAAWLVVLLFIGCLSALIAGLIPFLQDMNASLNALKLELEDEAGSAFRKS